MDASLKKILRGISLELRHTLEGWHDKKTGAWNPGDLERRLNEIGAWGDRPSKPLDEMPHLSAEDKAARRLVDGYLQLRAEAGVERTAAVAEFVRESAYTWANRLFALRCMEARTIIEEVILQKAAYAGRSLVHQRYLRKNPDAAKGEDDGLFAVLFAEFAVRSQELPALFDPKSPAVALRPSVAALKRCVALLSGTETVRGQDPATDEVFAAPDAFGWAYQYWNAEEKDRVFEMVRTKKAKIQRADIIPATQLYTEPYMVKFLVQNSLGALWMGMYPDSKLCEQWEYFVKDADRAPVTRKPVREITFLDPAQGSGHFHLEAFDLFYAMYVEEAARESRTLSPREIAAAILNHNLHGIDIDGRSVQIATAALWMKAKERAPDLEAGDLTSFHEHLVATNIRLPKGKDHLELFLQKHPEDKDLTPALELVFQGLEHADELGALLQIEEPVDAVLRRLKEEADKNKGVAVQRGLFEPTLVQGTLPVSLENYDKWKRDALNRLQAHFDAESQAADPVQAFFGESAGKSLSFFNVLARRFDVVAANPPYLTSRNMGETQKRFLFREFPAAKRDLYSSFIERSLRFAADAGRVAMVTMQSWTFLSAFSPFREPLLKSHSFELMARLGSGAFEEIGGQVVSVVLFIIRREVPSKDHRLVGVSCVAAPSPELKANALRQAAADKLRVSLTKQSEFLNIPAAAIIFWISTGLRRAMASPVRVGSVAIAKQGACTSDDTRFLRNWWETSELNPSRWPSFAKGGQFCRWWGNQTLRIDWEADGARVKTFTESLYGGTHWSVNIKNADLFLQPGWTYGLITSGSMSLRRLPANAVFGHKGPAVFQTAADEFALAAYLNSNLATYFLRQIAPSYSFETGSVLSLPWANALDSAQLRKLGRLATELGRRRCETRILEAEFLPTRAGRSAYETTLDSTDASLLVVQALIEREVTKALGLQPEDIAEVEAEVGSPIALLPNFPLPSEFFSELEAADEGSALKAALNCLEAALDSVQPPNFQSAFVASVRSCFETGASATTAEETAEDSEESEEDESVEEQGSLPPPSESLIEEISRRLSANPLLIRKVLASQAQDRAWRCPSEDRRLAEDRFTVLVLQFIGHRWLKQIEAAESLPAWADRDGVIPLTSGGGETPFVERLRERFAEDFPGGNVAVLEREFEEIVGVSLEQWLSGPFFERHISQFKKRPIAWQLETVASRQAAAPGGKGKKKRAAAGKPVFSCLVYYHKLDMDLLPKIRTQYVGLLNGGFETELRTLERLSNPTGDQQARRLQLEQWTDELQTFDRLLEDVSLSGFGPDALRPALRQYGINDALLSLTAVWLRRFSEAVIKGPLSDWADSAAKTELHPDLPKWLQDSMSNLNHFCAVLGPKPPDEKSIATDPTSKELAPLVCHEANNMLESSLKLGCDRWWKPLDAAVLEPLRQEIKSAKEEIEKIDGELKTEGLPYQRRNELGERKHELKEKVKSLKADHDDRSDRARKVRVEIERWTCPEAETWEAWLAEQPLFDSVASLDGQRPPPQSIADFITQESRYAPDINDGVRVNIAPIQKASLLHADVLDAKDADKAIADRAEWRADERRWVREGKLPQPGWWKENEGTEKLAALPMNKN